MKTKEIEQALATKTELRKPIPDEAMLSSGIDILNLSVTRRVFGTLAKGKYIWWVGDSETGKTWAALLMVAELCRNPIFDKYKVYYDDPEYGNDIDVPLYFGHKAARRIVVLHSESVEEFFYNLDDRIKQGPCFYILDSMDSIDSKDDAAKFEERKAAHKKGKQISGTYGTAKARVNSDNIKRMIGRLAKSGSMLMIISQTRDDIGNPHGGKRAGAGGRAMRFYAHVQIWTSLKQTLAREVMGKRRNYGSLIDFKIRKNRMSGRHGTITVPFLTDGGFDNVGASVDFLRSEGHWKTVQGKINAFEFNFKGNREQLIQHIEKLPDKREPKLAAIVANLWRKIDKATNVMRRKKYE